MNLAQIAQDFQKKYEHTYFWVTYETGRRYLSYLDRVTPVDSAWILRFRCTEVGATDLNFLTLSEFSFAFPENGLFDYASGVQRFIKIPTRQWKRAVCSQNCNLYDPMMAVLTSKRQSSLSFDTLRAAYESKYTTLGSAVEQITKRSVYARALNSKFGICMNFTKDTRPLLFYQNGIFIGNVVDSKTIHLFDHYFYQELVDLFTKGYPEYGITVIRH